MKTHVINDGKAVSIRAIATPTDDPTWDRCETKAFLSQQTVENEDQMDKMLAVLSDLAENGPPVPHDDSRFKKLSGTDDLFELKAAKLRLLCFWDGKMLIITHGFFKKTQKTPKYELDQAEKLKKDYTKAKQNNSLTHVEEN